MDDEFKECKQKSHRRLFKKRSIVTFPSSPCSQSSCGRKREWFRSLFRRSDKETTNEEEITAPLMGSDTKKSRTWQTTKGQTTEPQVGPFLPKQRPGVSPPKQFRFPVALGQSASTTGVSRVVSCSHR